jgi:ferredoxin-NAD(P)+ reductase (naphthalene dioxygenase ferredoxin-specific)
VLEFHIRQINGGASSVHAMMELSVGDTARVDGPYGACWLRESHTGAIIAIAGGSGLAPMKSIIKTALAKGMRQLIKLYVAAPSECDLYMKDHFQELERRFKNFAFLPVLQSPDRITKRRDCTVHDVVLTDGCDFTEVKVYAAGPPEMIDGSTQNLIAHGVQPTYIHTKPFHVAAAELMQEEGTD